MTSDDRYGGPSWREPDGLTADYAGHNYTDTAGVDPVRAPGRAPCLSSGYGQCTVSVADTEAVALLVQWLRSVHSLWR